MADDATLPTAEPTAQPRRKGVIPSRDRGDVILESAASDACRFIRQCAESELSAEGAELVLKEVELELSGAAELLLVEAANCTLHETPETWTEDQARRVRAPFELFGIERIAKIEDPNELRAALLCETLNEDGVLLSKQVIGKCCSVSIRHALKGLSKDVLEDPRTALMALSSGSTITVHGTASVLEPEDVSATPRLPPRCATTWRPLLEGDLVRRFCMRFEARDPPKDPPHQEGEKEEEGEARAYVYQGTMDHGRVVDRLPQDHAFRKDVRRKNLRVSDLGIHLLNFSCASEWIVERFHPYIEGAITCASGTLSHEVLQSQRAQHAGGGTKRPHVLKKNKPVQWEELLAAFEGCAYSDTGIERIVSVYQSFKVLQVGFLASFRLIGEIRECQQQQQPSEE